MPKLPVASALALAVLAAACAGPKTAPPPSMGDLSGPWMLETDGKPIRFVSAEGDTASLTVSPEPIVIRQGPAVSDTSIALDIAGIHVAGAMEVIKDLGRDTEGRLVTAGASEGTLTFFGPAVSFSGRWNDGAFTGELRLDPEQVDKHVVLLDRGRTWRLRRMGVRSTP